MEATSDNKQKKATKKNKQVQRIQEDEELNNLIDAIAEFENQNTPKGDPELLNEGEVDYEELMKEVQSFNEQQLQDYMKGKNDLVFGFDKDDEMEIKNDSIPVDVDSDNVLKQLGKFLSKQAESIMMKDEKISNELKVWAGERVSNVIHEVSLPVVYNQIVNIVNSKQKACKIAVSKAEEFIKSNKGVEIKLKSYLVEDVTIINEKAHGFFVQVSMDDLIDKMSDAITLIPMRLQTAYLNEKDTRIDYLVHGLVNNYLIIDSFKAWLTNFFYHFCTLKLEKDEEYFKLLSLIFRLKLGYKLKYSEQEYMNMVTHLTLLMNWLEDDVTLKYTYNMGNGGKKRLTILDKDMFKKKEEVVGNKIKIVRTKIENISPFEVDLPIGTWKNFEITTPINIFNIKPNPTSEHNNRKQCFMNQFERYEFNYDKQFHWKNTMKLLLLFTLLFIIPIMKAETLHVNPFYESEMEGVEYDGVVNFEYCDTLDSVPKQMGCYIADFTNWWTTLNDQDSLWFDESSLRKWKIFSIEDFDGKEITLPLAMKEYLMDIGTAVKMILKGIYRPKGTVDGGFGPFTEEEINKMKAILDYLTRDKIEQTIIDADMVRDTLLYEGTKENPSIKDSVDDIRQLINDMMYTPLCTMYLRDGNRWIDVPNHLVQWCTYDGKLYMKTSLPIQLEETIDNDDLVQTKNEIVRSNIATISPVTIIALLHSVVTIISTLTLGIFILVDRHGKRKMVEDIVSRLVANERSRLNPIVRESVDESPALI